MSWSVRMAGTPADLVSALENESTKYQGASKEEFDAALPHLVGLIKLNHAPDSKAMLEIDANGHATKQVVDGVMTTVYSQCSVAINPLHLNLVGKAKPA